MPDTPKRSYRKKDQAVNLEALGLELGNKPPQALDVEEAVLGAMLVEPSTIDESMEELTRDCFYDPRHRMIFEAMAELVTEHSAIDLVTVSEKLRAKGNLGEIGGPVALANLSQKIGAAAHIEYYIKILKQKTIQRDLITASHEILKQSYDDSTNVDELIDTAQTKIFDAIRSSVKKDVQDIGSLINEAMEDIEKRQDKPGLSGVPSGYPSIDTVTQGWQPSDLIILAARPSVGKTAFSLNVARNAAVDHQMPVAFFSLEMSAIQLVKRLMTSESGLSSDKIKGGSRLEDYEWVQLQQTLRNLSKAPLYIDDTPGIPLMEFRTKVKRLVKQVAAISRTLKATAKELNVPIIALSQLSRNSVQRSGATGKPQLSDLRESGSIEQDADLVIFIHRPDFVGMSENPEDKEKTFIIIAKHRNGETKDIPMLFKGEKVRFMEMDSALDMQAAGMTTESRMNSEFGESDFENAAY